MGKLSRKEKAGEKRQGRKAGNLASFFLAGPEAPKKCLLAIASKNDNQVKSRHCTKACWHSLETARASDSFITPG